MEIQKKILGRTNSQSCNHWLASVGRYIFGKLASSPYFQRGSVHRSGCVRALAAKKRVKTIGDTFVVAGDCSVQQLTFESVSFSTFLSDQFYR